MRIIDSHHHIWRQADLPWLMGPMQPRIFGPYEAIRRDYLIDEFREDLSDLGVSGSIYVQANWAPERFEDEVAWVQETADETGWPHGIVGYADCLANDIDAQLDRLMAYPLLRGIRMQLHWHQNEMYQFASRSDLCTDRLLIENVRKIGERGLCFDLQVFESQMADAALLARACPDVTFVLQHAGMPEDSSDEGKKRWQEHLAILAGESNVVCKLSGFGTFIHRNDPEHIAWAVGVSAALFGANRCMFGSNFPIEKLWTGYQALLMAHFDACAAMSISEREQIFYLTARRVYRLAD